MGKRYVTSIGVCELATPKEIYNDLKKQGLELPPPQDGERYAVDYIGRISKYDNIDPRDGSEEKCLNSGCSSSYQNFIVCAFELKNPEMAEMSEEGRLEMQKTLHIRLFESQAPSWLRGHAKEICKGVQYFDTGIRMEASEIKLSHDPEKNLAWVVVPVYSRDSKKHTPESVEKVADNIQDSLAFLGLVDPLPPQSLVSKVTGAAASVASSAVNTARSWTNWALGRANNANQDGPGRT